MSTTPLAGYLERSASVSPDATAAEDPTSGGSVTYAELNAMAEEFAAALREHGVGSSDRVGICAPKGISTVAAIFATLKVGAAYVPVDVSSPPQRNGFIFSDCGVSAIFAAGDLGPKLTEVLPGTRCVCELADDLVLLVPPVSEASAEPSPAGLAYILYTSGSTGNPKGVMLTHANATSFVDWCSDTFAPTSLDRFSSHAPFHFDLSILDLYVPIKHGATLVLIGESLGKQPVKLAECIAERRLTVWYSTPSILRLLTEFGKLDALDLTSLRTVLFAGEVFPIQQLRELRGLLPNPDYFNLYGPTETNVCTYFKLPEQMPANRIEPYPIGWCCENDRARVVDLDGAEVKPGDEGELLIAGGTVMPGYWRQPEMSMEAFATDAVGDCWYRTGDLVREEKKGCYTYIGRRDRMVKRRGYRVELGEIEAAFHRFPGVREAAAVVGADASGAMLIRVVLSWNECVGKKPSVIALKQYSMKNLPAYMVPDRFSFVDALPKTSTDKVDYRGLSEKVALSS